MLVGSVTMYALPSPSFTTKRKLNERDDIIQRKNEESDNKKISWLDAAIAVVRDDLIRLRSFILADRIHLRFRHQPVSLHHPSVLRRRFSLHFPIIHSFFQLTQKCGTDAESQSV